MTEQAEEHIKTARENLRLAIAIRGKTAAEVSREAGLSVNALSHFLKGRGAISYPNILAACEVLHIPIGILHHPNTITPARLNLHSELEALSARDLALLIGDLESLSPAEPSERTPAPRSAPHPKEP